jgi:signal transduction histidine kinase
MRLSLTDKESATPAYPPRVHAYAISRLYQSLPSVAALLALLPLGTAVVMWEQFDHRLVSGWLVAVLALSLARYQLARAFFRHQPRGQDALRWGHYFTLTAFASGVLWGGAGVVFFVPDSIGHQVFLYTLVIGMSAGSMVITSYWPAGLYAFVVPALGALIVDAALRGGTTYYGMAALTFVYALILVRAERTMHRSALAAIALRFENLDLIEQLQEQKLAAEEANVAKSKFLAAASHDLRQPLHALSLFVTVLRERSRASETRPLVENVASSVAALEGLFQALLDVSRLDAGIVQPKVVDFHLHTLLHRLLAEYQVHATAKGLRLEGEYTDAVVRSDPALLELILRNLLGNAIRYTAQGKVTLRGLPVENGVRLEVADTGIGIPPERHKDIFREFVQLGNPERDRTKGLGLGLAIVKRVTALLQHPIELRSQPGAGSCFGVVLPSGGAAAAVELAALSATGAGVSLDGLTVVVIDDEAAIRDGMQAVLEDWGCSVVTAAAADDALAALRARQATPNVVIADYRLREEKTGVQAIVQLQQEFGAEIPAMIITGDTAPERLREAQASGFLLMHKPLAPAKLRAALQRLRRGRRRTDRDA